MTVNEHRDFIFESYYKRIGFARENSYYSMKHQKKISTTVYNYINRKDTYPTNV